MIQQYGTLLLEQTEIVIRVYEADETEWRLTYYQSIAIQPASKAEERDADLFIDALAEFLITDDAQKIKEWKACSRGLSRPLLSEIASALSLTIENLLPLREQELLCKGMFTEFW